jgi:hypothetical protein
MKTLSLSNVLKAIKFTVTRDGRMAAGKFNYYEDATMDAVLMDTMLYTLDRLAQLLAWFYRRLLQKFCTGPMF